METTSLVATLRQAIAIETRKAHSPSAAAEFCGSPPVYCTLLREATLLCSISSNFCRILTTEAGMPNGTQRATDIAIVGAGITGLSIAWHLADKASVRVFDGSGVGSGATAIQPGGVRQQWGTEVACLMAREALAFYAEIGERLQPAVDPAFQACGYLFACHTPEELAVQAKNVALQNRVGIPSRLIGPDEAGALVPGLDPSSLSGGAWCESDGYFDRPQAVVAAFADDMQRKGATIVDRHVERLEHDGSGWRLVLRGGESTQAQAVVVAAAYDSPALLAPLGVALPITRASRSLFYSDPIRERLLEPLVVSHERGFAAKQLADGSVLAADLSAGTVPGEGREVWHRRVRATITELVPILEYVSFPVLVEGFYDVTPDRQPIFGEIQDHDGLWIAAGLNGRGLMMAPAVGRLLADSILGETADPTLDSLTLARFDQDELVHEAQVV
ncbi:MAG: FAD-binding oxidoreductase [Actinobacteria bacterium]|nr:FAD-binding oxidoreductase [Actinomycetota bacterium]